MSQLPEPVSVTDQYLKLLLEKQEEILAELKRNAPAPIPAGMVDLKEPSTDTRFKPKKQR